MSATKIEWTEETWNPVRGCSRISEGCRNCYAEKIAARFCGPGKPFEGFINTGPTRSLPTYQHHRGWTGRVELIPSKLSEPLHWRKPRRVFVNSMSDLFHESLSNEDIAAVFGVMAACPQHTFQVLTKRPERMRVWFEWVLFWSGFPHADPRVSYCLSAHAVRRYGVMGGEFPLSDWPLPYVWLGVSPHDQKSLDEMAPLLLDTPAAVRFLSLEPLLGPVDLGKWIIEDCSRESLGRLWVVCGGESGPGARPCHVEWIRSVVRQCKEARVPCFVKQVGARCHTAGEELGAHPDGHRVCARLDDGQQLLACRHRKGGDPAEWPSDLRVREYPG